LHWSDVAKAKLEKAEVNVPGVCILAKIVGSVGSLPVHQGTE
jgi:hypothetical protein